MKRHPLVMALAALIILLSGAMLVWFNSQSASDAPPNIELTNNFESNGFTVAYPEDWQYNIPQTNLFFLGSPAVMQQEAGASLAIQRIIRMSGGPQTLQEALTIYMENGPLRYGTDWTITEDIYDTTLDERPAVRVALEGADRAESERLHSEIVLTRADNSFIYVIAITTPLAQWQNMRPTLSAILESIAILE